MQQMGARRHPESRREFPRHGRPAQRRRRFEQQHRSAAARQSRGAYQAIMAAADDHAVVAQFALPRSRSTARAAFAPGAPMTPPPGWVLEPHMYTPRTGARYWA